MKRQFHPRCRSWLFLHHPLHVRYQIQLLEDRSCKWCTGLDLQGLRLSSLGLVCVHSDRLIASCLCLLIVSSSSSHWFDLLGNVASRDPPPESNSLSFEFRHFILLFWNHIFTWKFEEKIGIYCIFEAEALIFLERLL